MELILIVSRFALQILSGCLLFVLILMGAVGINLFTTWMSSIGMPLYITYPSGVMEYFYIINRSIVFYRFHNTRGSRPDKRNNAPSLGAVMRPKITALAEREMLDVLRRYFEPLSSIYNLIAQSYGISMGHRVEGRIEFENVSVRLNEFGDSVLDRLTFIVPEGSHVAILGRRGSGISLIPQLLRKRITDYDGFIRIDGINLREYNDEYIRSKLRSTSQEIRKRSGTIRQIIAEGQAVDIDSIVEVVRIVALEPLINALKQGYNTYITSNSNALMASDWQLLQLANILLSNPPIILLEGIFNNLDADSAAILAANLRRIAHGRTMVEITTKHLNLLQAKDQIVVIERGSVYDIGTHEDLLERCDIYAGLWHLEHRHLHPERRGEVIPPRAAS